MSGGRWEGSLRKEGGGVRDVGMVGDERSSRRGDGKVLGGCGEKCNILCVRNLCAFANSGYYVLCDLLSMLSKLTLN